jgi:4-amino-4-deoxy-L-arabinose transferase-like glycosyltransferase
VNKCMTQSQAPEDLFGSSAVLPRDSRWLVIGVLALAATIRAFVSSRTDSVAFDSVIYFDMAQYIRAGAWDKVLSYPFPPFFPLLLASLERASVPTEAAGLFLSFALSLGVLVPLFFIARDLAGPRAALGAIFLWAVHPYAVRLSVRALSDTPTVFFVALALWAGLYSLKQKKVSYGLLAGMLSGFAYLARPEGIEPALVLAAVFGIFLPLGPAASGPARRVLLRAAWITVPLLGWVLVASPYIAYISAQAGSLTLSKKKSVQVMVGTLAVPLSEAEKMADPTAMIAPESDNAVAGSSLNMPQRPSQHGWLWRAGQSVYIFQQPLVNGVYPVVLVLAIWGMIEIRSGKISAHHPTLMLLTGLTALHFLILVGVAADQGADYLGGHHFFLLVLYLIPLAGTGLLAAVAYARAWAPRARWAPAAVVALIAVLTIPVAARHRHHRGDAMRPAGAWVRDHLPQERVVVSNDRKFSFHAAARRIALGNNAKTAVAEGRKQGAVFAASYSDGRQASALRELVRSGDLELAAEFPERSGNRSYTYQIYRILPGDTESRL